MSVAAASSEAPLSHRARVMYVALAVLLIALMGGAVYGWPTMRQILRRDKLLLTQECVSYADEQTCDSQELSFGLIFTIGSWSNQGGRLFIGIALDRFGPCRTATVCAAFCGLGALIFGLTDSIAGLSAGYFLIGGGGAGMQLSLQSVSALFPKNKALVMATLSGAFQAASGVFLIMDVLHRLDVPREALLLGYAIVLLAATLICATSLPAKPFGVGNKKPAATPVQGATPAAAESDNAAVVPLSKRTFREQALSPLYLIMVTYFSLAVLQAQFTVGTVGTQLQLMGDVSGELARFFNLCFSLSWTVAPFVGHMVDRLGVPSTLVLMNTLLLCCPLLLATKSLPAQFALGVLYAVSRVSIWAVFFSFMGNIFGFANFGKLAGGGLFIASCLSLLQYVLLSLTVGVFQRDFLYVNIFFIGLCVLMYPLIAWLAHHLRKNETNAKPMTPHEQSAEPVEADKPDVNAKAAKLESLPAEADKEVCLDAQAPAIGAL